MKEISTGRLFIKPLEVTDYESWFTGFSERKPSQNPFDEGLRDMSICTEEWFESLVKKHQKLSETDDTYIFAIFDKQHHHIGMIDFATLARDTMNWGELGYFIHNQLWRNGYAFEALSAVLKVVSDELGYHRIEAHVSLDNKPSKQLLKKLGFSFEVIRKQFMFECGQWSDKEVYFLNLNNKDL